MKALIFVAGYATRMYPLTLDKPKALLPLGGRPVIDYILEQINQLPAVDKVYVVTNHKFAPQFDMWAREAVSAIPIELLDDGTTNEEDRRGAIGDIYYAICEKGIDDDLLVVAGDNYFTYSLTNYYAFFKEKGSDAVCAIRESDRKRLRQLAVAKLDDCGKVTALVEKPQEPESDIAIYATYFYKKETLPLFARYLEEGNSPDAPGYFVQWLHKIKDVYAFIMDGECYDIGTIEMYEAVNASLLKGKI
jgi:glucose-1-phosphate thymidylyltransferase